MIQMTHILYITALLVCAHTQQGGRCGCREPNFLRDNFTCAAKYVFAGEVIRAEGPRTDPSVDGRFQTYCFYLTQIWKGPWTDTLKVNTFTSRTECRPEFEIGERYIVFAKEQYDGLWTNACYRNKRVEIRDWTRYWLSTPVYSRPGYGLSKIEIADLFNVSDNSNNRGAQAASEKNRFIQTHRDEITAILSRSVRKDKYPKHHQKPLWVDSLDSVAKQYLPIVDWILTNGSVDIKVDVIYVLREIFGIDDYFPLYRRVLRDSSLAVRASALSCMPAVRRTISPELKVSLVEMLVERLEDPECEMRCWIVKLFPGFVDSYDEAEPKLRKVIETDDCDEVVGKAMSTLEWMKQRRNSETE